MYVGLHQFCPTPLFFGYIPNGNSVIQFWSSTPTLIFSQTFLDLSKGITQIEDWQFMRFLYYIKIHLLCILTSFWMLAHPKAGGNIVKLAFLYFFFFMFFHENR
jgi:hypothetical protein